jgi:hypothetical protein
MNEIWTGYFQKAHVLLLSLQNYVYFSEGKQLSDFKLNTCPNWSTYPELKWLISFTKGLSNQLWPIKV